METIANIKEAIKESKSVAIVSNENFYENEILAREALRIILQEKGLSVYSFPEETSDFKKKWQAIIPSNKKANSLFCAAIRVPKTSFKIKEINYDEDDEFYNLNISTSEGEIGKEGIIVEPRPVAVDAVFCFGRADFSNHPFLKKISLPTAEKIFYINGESTSAEKVFDIIQAVGPEQILAGNPIPTILLASLFVETNCLKGDLTKTALNLASALLGLGADQKTIKNAMAKNRSPYFAQILGRAMARTRTNETLKSIWTFISTQDLEKTGNEKADIPLFSQIISRVREVMPPYPVSVLAWQSEENIWALVYATDDTDEEKNIPKKLSEELNIMEENGFMLAGPYKNFSEAELKIQNALKEIKL